MSGFRDRLRIPGYEARNSSAFRTLGETLVNFTNPDSVAIPHRISVLQLSTVVVGLAATLGIGIVAGRPDFRYMNDTEAECGNLSRVVARHSQSMLDGEMFRKTARQAYQVCVSDPAAFRRIVR